MSNSKKNWNASKALKRAVEANKKSLKVHAAQSREMKKKVAKGKM